MVTEVRCPYCIVGGFGFRSRTRTTTTSARPAVMRRAHGQSAAASDAVNNEGGKLSEPKPQAQPRKEKTPSISAAVTGNIGSPA